MSVSTVTGAPPLGVDPSLAVRNVWKTYPGGVRGLQGATLDVPAGMLFGLLGPNGAGKSTLMKILATLLVADEGTAHLGGVELTARGQTARALLGYLPQEFGFHAVLTAEETLDFFAALKGVSDARQRRLVVGELLERVNLSAARRRRVGEFSGGMRQRLGIAQALLGGPRLLVVDEPTSGLDPVERARFHALLEEVAATGAVVLLSTHIVADVAELCARMAILVDGRVVAEGTPADAVRSMSGAVWEGAVAREQAARIAEHCHVLATHPAAEGVRVRALARDGPPTEAFRPSPPTLEDYYVGVVDAAGRA